MIKHVRLASGIIAAAAIVSACASPHSGAVLPQSQNPPSSTQAVTQSGTSITESGPITGILSSTEFSLNAGTGCGSIHVYTNSSTVWSPAGSKAVTGETVKVTGTGTCATSITASSVTVTSSSTPTPAPTATPFPASETIGSGEIFGLDNAYSPADGDTSSGGQGQTVDGLPCASTMPSTYHVHAFLGIIINGRQYAMPDGAGMKSPGADGTYQGVPNWTEYASCYYYLHTHDASGVIHIESPQSASQSTSLYTLRNFFDVWGRVISSSQIGPFTGTVTAYVAQVPLKQSRITASNYTQFTGNPGTIPLKSHTTIWLEIGPKIYTPAQLPVLNYYEEY